MSPKPSAPPNVIGQVAVKLTGLPEEDLQIVIELVDYLEEQRSSSSSELPLSASEIREKARRRAVLLKDVPRDQLAARFMELGEEIRQEAIAKGTAVDGDWTGD